VAAGWSKVFQESGELCNTDRMDCMSVDIVVIGGGQAGLAIGYYLQEQRREFLIVDANELTGDSWRMRWDSLRLFTPASFDGLPGLPFPAPGPSFPTKNEMADYLQRYAADIGLPIRHGVRVERLARDGGRYIVEAKDFRLTAARAVVATGPYRAPFVPNFAGDLDPGIVQLHSSQYRRPDQLRDGVALVVGAGNSGAEIALELASTHDTLLSGRDTGHIPITLGGTGFRLLTLLSPGIWPGSAIARLLSGRGDPLVRVSNADLESAGVQRVPRFDGVIGGRPVLTDGRVLDAANVLWCTGFVPDLDWIDLPVVGSDGAVSHERGVMPDQPGLYFVGLPFQSSIASQLVGGVGADAKYISEKIATGPGPRP
jgi:putative flavoprotein involved in K+ transport